MRKTTISLLPFGNAIANKSFAQCYMVENAPFFLNDTLSTGEKQNTIQGALSGKGALVFNTHHTCQNQNIKNQKL